MLFVDAEFNILLRLILFQCELINFWCSFILNNECYIEIILKNKENIIDFAIAKILLEDAL